MSLYRIYRDTRFSPDKTPLKTHAAAVFPWRGLARHEAPGCTSRCRRDGCGRGKDVRAAPAAARESARAHRGDVAGINRITRKKTFVGVVQDLAGERLTRVPRGFPPDARRRSISKYRQFIAGREFPAASPYPDFYPTLLATFTAILPLVRFLTSRSRRHPSRERQMMRWLTISLAGRKPSRKPGSKAVSLRCGTSSSCVALALAAATGCRNAAPPPRGSVGTPDI